MLRNFVNARRKFRAGVRSTLPFERNVIFPTFWIARDVISNSRQSTDIYRRYLTWFRFVVHHVVRRGVICGHNSPLNVALDACAEPCLFFFLFPPPFPPPPSLCSTRLSPPEIPHFLPLSADSNDLWTYFPRITRQTCPESILERAPATQ